LADMRVRVPSTTNHPILAAAVAAIAAAALITAGAMLVAGAPIAWLWLGACAAATIPLLVWFVARGRFFEPLPVLLTVAALLFVARPLQLFLGWKSLFSYLYTRDSVESLILLETQELALFVSERLQEPLETAFARAQGACALFLGALLAGYWASRWVPFQGRLARMGGHSSSINERAAIACALAIGVAAQAAIIVRAGGPVAALQTAAEQRASSDSFVLFLLASFSTAALVIWVAWRRPRETLERVLLAVSTGTVAALWLLTGSRARVFITLFTLAVVVNYVWRRWRARELLVAALLLLAFTSSAVVFRTVADERTLGEAASESAERVFDQRVILNDLTAYDSLMLATTIYGRARAHRRGGFLIDAVRSYVPRRLDSGKPEGGDITFRQLVWGEQFTAGRPPTAIGDFFIDFGLWGVAVGGLMLGAACRVLLSWLHPGPGCREYRVALFSLSLVVLYEFMVGTYSIAIGFAITLLLPFLIAVHGLGRLPRVRTPAAREPA
jgi:oligosaccharide repeat unit polymerase